ncbi:DEAD/DEAH box helicase [Psychrobacillus soli]|uniref:DEAD/DEAH box helicase n=1 Tax=Psychrobacillus soli TaxID=1543965 RepID=A0A544TBG8_9BACI|nr:DEAD/DEAH box helicase family protein [Psychrobacillus soli]TQR14736.1 DEAD/DEAH box helicase [Psychrobacillus soli]
MVTINLPVYEKIYYKKSGSRNIVKQLIDEERVIEGAINKVETQYINIKVDTVIYCFTKDKSKFDLDAKYVLLVDKDSLNVLRANRSEITIKKWVKHPQDEDEITNQEIINSWKNNFNFKEESVEDNEKGLRRPQIAALHAIHSHVKVSKEIATVVMPTGTGKTETMLSTLISLRCSKLLVTVPSDALRQQVGEKFITLGLLKKFGIVNESIRYPRVGILHNGFQSVEELDDFIGSCNVIVTNMPLISMMSEEQQLLLSEKCTHIFIDEAHHIKASTWESFRKKFDDEKIIQYTATPFRNDGKNLDGKIIFNFPLIEAQKDGYFTEIEFLPIKEYDLKLADKLIAEKAVLRLETDLEEGFPHILMARCADKKRAKEVYSIYKQYEHLHPVLIYSKIPNKKEIYNDILLKKHKIIICVDMLGEGFDLPELKIAALHDIKKSLPVTLQFTGRFTRTKYDSNLGKAAFIANIADLNVSGALEDLYSSDADWNELLADYSSAYIDDEMEYKSFLEGFANLNQSIFSFQNIRPKLSTVVYRTQYTDWNPKEIKSIYTKNQNYEYVFYDENPDEKIAIVVYAKKSKLDWLSDKNTYNLTWNMLILLWNPTDKLLFINSTDNSSLYKDIADKVIKNPRLINKMEVFKALYNIKRIKLQNVGLKLHLGKDIRYRMSVGSDLGEAIPLMEKQRSQKAYVVGAGFENGEPVNIGCSYKGRIWTKLQGNVKGLKVWSDNIGKKILNPDIDPNQVLSECLVPTMIYEMPKLVPIAIDWDYEILFESETTCIFTYGENTSRNLSEVELQIQNYDVDEKITFKITIGIHEAIIEFNLSKLIEEDLVIPDHTFKIISAEAIIVKKGTRTFNLDEFLYEYLPTFWFADGSSLTGNEFIQLKHTVNQYPKELLISRDWRGTELSKESQQVDPKRTDSIQYKMIEYLKSGDYQVIYDDDGSGEIADILTIKEENNLLTIQLYHLKYAAGGKVSNSIDNLYQVCGQAQKSIHWKYKKGEEFFKHLLRRIQKNRDGKTCSRLEKGTKEDLEVLKDKAKRRIPMQFEIFIVQPSISKERVGEDILTLLGVTESFIKETSGINVKVICSE